MQYAGVHVEHMGCPNYTCCFGARSWLTVSLVSGGLGRLWFESIGSFGDALKLGLTL